MNITCSIGSNPNQPPPEVIRQETEHNERGKMKTANFKKIIDTLQSGKTITFWTAHRGTKVSAKHIPLLKNEREDDQGLWIGKTFFLIPSIKMTVGN